MKVIGLTGGIGSGKSTVLNILKNRYNACVMLADDIGKQAMIPGSKTYHQMVQAFGAGILRDDGSIDTAELSAVLMSDGKKLAMQNEIVHPYVIHKIEGKLANIKSMEKGFGVCLDNGKADTLVAIESAILFEAGCDRLCDEIWVVTVTRETRIERLMRDRGYSREKAEAFISHQMSDAEYIARADRILYNDGGIEELRRQIKEVMAAE